MTGKLQRISELQQQTFREIMDSPGSWVTFLITAGNNFKYTFPDQVLIYAQKPDATACAAIDLWNTRFDRRVHLGKTSISLLDDHDGHVSLRHVFDVADTYSRTGQKFELWQAEPRFHDDIIDALEDRFGDLFDRSDLGKAIMSAVDNIVQDNIGDYLAEIAQADPDFTGPGRDDMMRRLLVNSISFMMFSRCGLDKDRFFRINDFADIVHFKTLDDIYTLGSAASDMAESGLRVISDTVNKLMLAEKLKNRTVAEKNDTGYHESVPGNTDEPGNSEKKGDINEDNILNGQRISGTGSGPAGTAEGASGQVRDAQEGLPYTAPQGQVFIPAGHGDTDTAPGGYRYPGQGDDEQVGNGNGRTAGSDREAQGGRSDGVGPQDEQHQKQRRGDSPERSDIRITDLPDENQQDENAAQAEAEKASAFIISQEETDAVLTSGSGVSQGKMRIYEQYLRQLGHEANIAFLKNEYGIGGAYPILNHFFENHNGKGIYISRGLINSPEAKIFLPWKKVEKRIGELIAADRYLSEPEKKAFAVWREESSSNIPENDSNQTQPPKKYKFSLGDKVFLGIDSYEIIAVGDAEVRLYDEQFPLINKVMAREEFDRKVRENPLNDHFAIETGAKSEDTELDHAKRLINEYCNKEFGTEDDDDGANDADFGDLNNVGLAFTEVDGLREDELEIQVSADLVNYHIDRYLNGILFENRKYATLTDFIDTELERLDFVDLVYVSDEQFQRYYSLAEAGKTASPEKSELSEPSGLPDTLKVPTAQKKNENRSVDLHPQIQRNDRINYRITADDLGVGTPSQRYAANVSAIRLLKQIELEDRFALPAEQEILAKYVGWGGLSDCFDEKSSHYTELKELLTEEEYSFARESTLTAFYTPPVVIKSIYSALENLGFKTGNILEPSCGTGNFFGLIPASMSDSRMYGVELDPISGRIAQQLYQNNSIAVGGYEMTDLPNSFFDAAVGNVPFGEYSVADKRYDKNNFMIHDYFFAKTLDKVRPGGIIAFVTSKGTLDKENPSVRRYIAQRADLLGAIRLPDNTFKAAGTEVTSDIIFLQKRDRMLDIDPDWVNLGSDGNGVVMNRYYIDHPDMVCGDMRTVPGPYGPQTVCKAGHEQQLADMLGDAIFNIHADISEYDTDISDDAAQPDSSMPADPSVRNFSYTVFDGRIYYRSNSRMNLCDVTQTEDSRIRGMIGIRDCVRTLLDFQVNDSSDERIKAKQAELNRLYDDFTSKYGLISVRANRTAFEDDSSYSLLASLEVIDENGKFVRKADIFSKRTVRPHMVITHTDTAAEALALSLSEKAGIDMKYMTDLTGRTEEEIVDELRGGSFSIRFSRKIPGHQNTLPQTSTSQAT